MSLRFRGEGKSIGFVPTMGALHEGHLSLVGRSKEDNDVTIVSVFVNPTQFGPDEDYQKYPRETEGDLEKLSTLDVETVFLPDNNEMYPEGFSISIDVGKIGQVLCGMSRPGHFNGVATVVAKLFNIVIPDRAYFGQKDLQQTLVIRKLVKELDFRVDVIICPVVRESDGLAMSSRNSYLNQAERKAAIVLYNALTLGYELILSEGMKDVTAVRNEMIKLIKSEPLTRIDYVEILNSEDLEATDKIQLPVAICLAAYIGNTRLIDNMIVE